MKDEEKNAPSWILTACTGLFSSSSGWAWARAMNEALAKRIQKVKKKKTRVRRLGNIDGLRTC